MATDQLQHQHIITIEYLIVFVRVIITVMIDYSLYSQ